MTERAGVWLWLERAAAFVAVIIFLPSVLAMWDAAKMSRQTARFEAQLMMMEAEQRIADGIILVSQYNDLAQSSDPKVRDAASRDLKFAIYRLDALIVGIDSWAMRSSDLSASWVPYFSSLCEKLKAQAFLVRNELGLSLEGTQNACSR